MAHSGAKFLTSSNLLTVEDRAKRECLKLMPERKIQYIILLILYYYLVRLDGLPVILIKLVMCFTDTVMGHLLKCNKVSQPIIMA